MFDRDVGSFDRLAAESHAGLFDGHRDRHRKLAFELFKCSIDPLESGFDIQWV